jgi:hypothetical protein
MTVSAAHHQPSIRLTYLMSSNGSPSEPRRPVGRGLMEMTVIFSIPRNLAAVGVFQVGDQFVTLSRGGSSR